jgi:hypothetical protein
MISRILNQFKPRSNAKEALAPQIDAYLTYQFIAKAIISGAPFLASRLGFTEARCLSQPEGIENPSDFVMNLIWRYSGVFPASQEQFRQFGSIYLGALSQVDLLGLICNPAEKKLVDVHARNVVTCDLGSLEPYLYPFSWSKHLQSKCVLVVHPFVESIQAQYERRERLFVNPDVLPEFELQLLRSPQTLAGNLDGYASWTEAYEKMRCAISAMEFDVAILGCGAYGLPLGAHIKSIGKIAIHLGGATQLLFGISGKRWADKPAFQAIMTDAWRFPLENEKPRNLEMVEEGCYW